MIRKNELTTKLISVVTSVVLAVGLVPLPAFAAPGGTETAAPASGTYEASEGAETAIPASETDAASDDGEAAAGTSSQPLSLTVGANGAIGATGANGAGMKTQEDGATQVDSWLLLQDCVENAANGAVFQLTADAINRSSRDRIKVKTNVTIDLAGYTVDRQLTSVKSNGHVFEVFEGATLTIKDSVGGGKITGGYSKYGGGIYINAGATVNIEGGTIYKNYATADGGGVYVGGTLNMTGGAISENEASYTGGGMYVPDGGEIHLSGATISANTAKQTGGGINAHLGDNPSTIDNCNIVRNVATSFGGGLRLDAKGKTLTITDSHIDNNTAHDDGGGIYVNNGTLVMQRSDEQAECTVSNNTTDNDGGGIKVTSKTAFQATGVTISGNTAKSAEGGGVKNYGTTTLKNCTITLNSAKKQGGGIFNDDYDGSEGTMTLENCFITKNDSDSDGAGVYTDRKLKIVGGTITGNVGTGKGGGLFVGLDSNITEIEGELVIEGNGTEANTQQVYLRKEQKLTLSGALTSGARIGITTQETEAASLAGAAPFTEGFKDKNANHDPSEYFFSPSGFDVGFDESGEEAQFINSWTQLQDLIDAAAKSGETLTLTRDYSAAPSGAMLLIGNLSDRLLIRKGTTVTIDLNGHTLNRNLTIGQHNGHVIEVLEHATLTIKDSSAVGGMPGTGKITGGYSQFGGGIYVNKNATLNVEKGTIAGNKAKEYGGGIYVLGTLNMTGGTIEGNEASTDGGGIHVADPGKLNLNSATITGNHASAFGGGICLDTSKDASVSNCEISSNEAGTRGGGVFAGSDGKTLTISGTRINGNKARWGAGLASDQGTDAIVISGGALSDNEASEFGGGIWVAQHTTLTARDATISGNKAGKYGGGGIKNQGIATLVNCTISGNSTKGNGGGIANGGFDIFATSEAESDLTLEGCTVFGNSASTDGGGVFSGKKLAIKGGSFSRSDDNPGNSAGSCGGGICIASGSASIEGKIDARGNAAGFGKDLYMGEGTKLTVTGSLGGTNIGSIDMDECGVLTDGYSTWHPYGDSSSDPARYFSTDDGAIPAKWTDDQKEVQISSEWTKLQEKIDAAAASGQTLVLDRNYTASANDTRLQIRENTTVTINLAGHKLDRNRRSKASNGHVFEVFDGATLTIEDKDAEDNYLGTGTITGGNSQWGGGIYVNGGGTLNFNGGIISGNKANEFGGGIFGDDNSTVNVSNGIITDNKSDQDGGGICVRGTLNTTGGIIVGNKASETGGGIYADWDSAIHLDGTTITGNSADENGGGLNVHTKKGSNSSIVNCTIAQNQASDHGGGLRFEGQERTLAIENTAIDYNTAGGQGGGIYLLEGTVQMTGGSLSGNTSTSSGGGIAVTKGTTFTAAGSTIKGNESTTKHGGGIASLGEMWLTNCEVSDNSAADSGGGIYSLAMAELTGCTVSGNSAQRCGGGIYSELILALVGGSIYENNAMQSGGGVFVGSMAAETSIEGDLRVENNTAQIYGDNVLLRSGKRLTLTGPLTVADYPRIGVDLESGTGVFTQGYTSKNEDLDPNMCFFVAKGYDLALEDGEAEICSEWSTLQGKIDAAAGSGQPLVLDRDYTASANDERLIIRKDTTVKIDLNGHTLDRNRGGEMILLDNHPKKETADGQVFEVLGTLTLVDESTEQTGTITGGWATYGGGVLVGPTGMLDFQSGAISGNKANAGGGIFVSIAGSLRMSGGSIAGNESTGSGGGIGLDRNSSVDLQGGTISGNEAGEYGGGIMVGPTKRDVEGAKISVGGSPVVRKNKAASAGNDIYVARNGLLDVVESLTENAKMGIAIQQEKGKFTSGYGAKNGTENPAKHFVSTQGYSVYLQGNEAVLDTNTQGETDREKPFIDWKDQIESDEDALSNQNWMSGISGERYLNEINMPGSHDSGMKNVHCAPASLLDTTSILAYALPHMGAKYAQTQTEYINQQLEAGARQLDLRLNDCYKDSKWYLGGQYVWEDNHKDLWIAHGTNEYTGNYLALGPDGDFLSFRTVLNWVTGFLEDHPTETIILNIRPETTQSGHSGAIQKRARKILEEIALKTNRSTGEPFLYKESDATSYFSRYTHMPQLKDCRGKILLMPDSDSFVDLVGGFIPSEFVDYTDPTHYSLSASEQIDSIRDSYATMNPNSNSQSLPTNSDSTYDFLWYWELNCTGEDHFVDTYVGGPNPVDNAKRVNPALIGDSKTFGPDISGQYIGWVRMDAFNALYSEKIWITNFFDKLEYCTVTVKSGMDDPNYPDQTYEVLKGTELTIPGNIYKMLPQNKCFANQWKATGNVTDATFKPGDSFKVEEDVTFTAQWLDSGQVFLQIRWQDGDDADGLRPNSVNFVLRRDSGNKSIAVTADEGWNYIISDSFNSILLDWNLVDTSEGQYGQDADGQYRYVNAGSWSTGYTFTFIHTPQVKAAVKGEVVWDDGNNIDLMRPASVTVNLLDNGTKVATATATAEGGWEYAFDEREQYRDGEKIRYSVTMDAVDGYGAAIDGFTITNTHVPRKQDVVKAAGFMEWDDDDNALGNRPASVTVRLLAGDDAGDEVAALNVATSAYASQSFSFGEIPVFDSEWNKIAYTVTIDEIPGYESTIQNPTYGEDDPNAYAFRITNSLTVPDDQKEPAMVKSAPKPYELTYDGTEQTLVKEGSGSGGKMMYALGQDDAAAPAAEAFSADLPVAKDAGTYFVWYYVKGNRSHEDTEPACVTATIAARQASITVADATKMQGELDPDFTGEVEGLVEPDDLGELKYVRTNTDEAVGEYEGVLDAEYVENDNYIVSVTKGAFTISETVGDTYTVHFDANATDATGLMEDQTMVIGTSRNLFANKFARDGYDFDGWRAGPNGSGARYGDGQSVTNLTETVGEKVTLYAQWRTARYEIDFWNDDGTLLQSRRMDSGMMPEYTAEIPTKKADAQYTYTFAGWSPEIVAVTGPASYTATYDTGLNSYEVNFVDYNGAPLYAPVAYEYGTKAEDIQCPSPTRWPDSKYLYTFAGWSPELTDVTEDIEYRAVYNAKANEYTVQFVANPPANASTSIVGRMASQVIRYDEHKALRKNGFLLPGYDFNGWNTKADGTGAPYADEAEVQNLSSTGGTVKLYAQWSPKQYKITFLSSGEDGAQTHEQTAFFDQTGTLHEYSTFGWSPTEWTLYGWSGYGFGSLYVDGDSFCNLCGSPDSCGEIYDVELLAQWIKGGRIVVAVTKDGGVQEGLETSFVLAHESGTSFKPPFTYKDGAYVFDPVEATGQIPPGDYSLSLETDSYPLASAKITYGEGEDAHAELRYCTVSLVKDPAYPHLCDVEIDGGKAVAGEPNTVVAPEGGFLHIKTTVEDGCAFGGYTYEGSQVNWEDGNPSKEDQTIQVTGPATITAKVSTQLYSVTVVGGTADASFALPKDVVTITADNPADGYAFVQWSLNDGVDFSQADRSKTTFVMPGRDVTVHAVFKEITLEALDDQVYTGNALTPTFGPSGVTLDGTDAVLSDGYELTYADNVNAGTAKATVTMREPLVGSKTATFKILPADISMASVSAGQQVYSGAACEPNPTVVWNGMTLVKDKDYTLSYADNVHVGTASVIVTGKGNFRSDTSARGSFKIVPRAATITVADASKAIGQADPAFTGDVEGLVRDGDLGKIAYVRTNTDEAVGTYKGVLSATYTANPDYDVTVRAGDFTIKQLYTAKFVNWNGKVLQKSKVVAGQKPVYTGKTPKRPATAWRTYTFKGWSPKVKKATGDVTYKAKFKAKKRAYDVLVAKAVAVGDDGLTVSWNKVRGVDGYDVFFARCNHGAKEYTLKKVASVKSGSKLVWETTGLEPQTTYKARVRAYVKANGKKVYVRTGKLVHTFTSGGTDVRTDAKSVSVGKKSVSLAKGKTAALDARVAKLNKDKKLMSPKHVAILRFVSSNHSVATVNSKGVIEAVGKGTCYVYAIAHNGVSKRVEVTVR